MTGRNVDYWALGHIHKREVVSENPYIVYPGNIQGRHLKETEEKGMYLVTVKDDTVSNLEFVPTQKIIWKDIGIDITGMNSISELTAEIIKNNVAGAIVRIKLNGRCNLDKALRSDRPGMTQRLEKSSGCIISELILNTTPELDLKALSGGKDLFAGVIASSESLDGLSKEELIDRLCHTKQSETVREYLGWMTEAELKSLVHDAEMYLLDKLRGVSS
jgi:exonuclease SbcD